MVGFIHNGDREEKSEGMYADLVGKVVRLIMPNGHLNGTLEHSDFVGVRLRPYVINQGTDLHPERLAKITDNSAVFNAGSVLGIVPLGADEKYLDELVEDAAEKDKMSTYLGLKDLMEKGYFEPIKRTE